MMIILTVHELNTIIAAPRRHLFTVEDVVVVESSPTRSAATTTCLHRRPLNKVSYKF